MDAEKNPLHRSEFGRLGRGRSLQEMMAVWAGLEPRMVWDPSSHLQEPTFSCRVCRGAAFVMVPCRARQHFAPGLEPFDCVKPHTVASPCLACDAGQEIAAGQWSRYCYPFVPGSRKRPADRRRLEEFARAVQRMGPAGGRVREIFDRVVVREVASADQEQVP